MTTYPKTATSVTPIWISQITEAKTLLRKSATKSEQEDRLLRSSVSLSAGAAKRMAQKDPWTSTKRLRNTTVTTLMRMAKESRIQKACFAHSRLSGPARATFKALKRILIIKKARQTRTHLFRCRKAPNSLINIRNCFTEIRMTWMIEIRNKQSK